MKNPTIKYGLILGLISVFIQWLLYAAGEEVMATWWVGIIVIVLSIALIVIFSLRIKKEKGGYWTFKQAFFSIFTMCVISSTLYTINSLLLYSVIDPELPQRMKEITAQKTLAMLESFGAPQESIDKTMDQLEKQPNQFSTLNLIKGYFWGFIGSAILTLIIAAIVKKNPPLIDESSLDSGLDSPSVN